jgi:hypothetical protein
MSLSTAKLIQCKLFATSMVQKMLTPNPKTTLESQGSGEPFTQDRFIHQ